MYHRDERHEQALVGGVVLLACIIGLVLLVYHRPYFMLQCLLWVMGTFSVTLLTATLYHGLRGRWHR
jgi:hypothetical protein